MMIECTDKQRGHVETVKRSKGLNTDEEAVDRLLLAFATKFPLGGLKPSDVEEP